jgi:hypothetical protein
LDSLAEAPHRHTHADNRADTGRAAMRIAAVLSGVPKPRATVLALNTS